MGFNSRSIQCLEINYASFLKKQWVSKKVVSRSEIVWKKNNWVNNSFSTINASLHKAFYIFYLIYDERCRNFLCKFSPNRRNEIGNSDVRYISDESIPWVEFAIFATTKHNFSPKIKKNLQNALIHEFYVYGAEHKILRVFFVIATLNPGNALKTFNYPSKKHKFNTVDWWAHLASFISFIPAELAPRIYLPYIFIFILTWNHFFIGW